MKWRKMLKVISNIITTLLFTVLIVIAFAVFSFKASGGEPTFFGYQLKTVLSGSMEPEIQTGSIIAIKPGGDMTRFDKGDVITYRTGDDILITHRIVQVKREGKQYITKGDSNDGPDLKPVFSKNVVGIYTGFTAPYLGYVMNFANSQQGVALLLILPGILLLVYSVITITRSIKQVEGTKEQRSTADTE